MSKIIPTSPRKNLGSFRRMPTCKEISRSATNDADYFARRKLRSICIQKRPWGDFLPEATEIIPRLYIADIYTATNEATVRALGITHVVSVVKTPGWSVPSGMRHLKIPVSDTEGANLWTYLENTVAWIKYALDSSPDARVMVHCVWGMSRSATVVLAYLMATMEMSLSKALVFTRNKRSVVQPNAGFMEQLKCYEERLRQHRMGPKSRGTAQPF